MDCMAALYATSKQNIYIQLLLFEYVCTKIPRKYMTKNVLYFIFSRKGKQTWGKKLEALKRQVYSKKTRALNIWTVPIKPFSFPKQRISKFHTWQKRHHRIQKNPPGKKKIVLPGDVTRQSLIVQWATLKTHMKRLRRGLLYMQLSWGGGAKLLVFASHTDGFVLSIQFCWSLVNYSFFISRSGVCEVYLPLKYI